MSGRLPLVPPFPRHFHCLLSVCPLSISQQAESEVLRGWGLPAKGLTH